MAAVFCAAAMGLVFSSCERIYEDLDPCPHGVSSVSYTHLTLPTNSLV